MPTLNVAKVVNNPKFAETFTIIRSQGGSFDYKGDWQDQTVNVQMWGIVQPATKKELLQVPEADRVKEVKSFHSMQEMRVTHTNGVNDNTAGISDIVIWGTTGEQYRLEYLYPWEDFGYFKALGVRIAGE